MDSDAPFHKIAPGEKAPVKLRPNPGFRKDSPHPEPQKPNITGRWESVVDDPKSPPKLSWILIVNQSSTWIEGRLVEVLDSRSKRARAVQAICGEASPSGTAFAIQPVSADETGDGSIEIDGENLIVNFNKGDWPTDQRFVLMPDGKRASFFGPAVDDVLASKGPLDANTKTIIIRAETMPLHSWQVRKLQRLLDPDYVHNLLLWAYTKHFLTSSFDERSRRLNAVMRIQDLIHAAVPSDVTSKEPGPWNRGDLPLVRALARTILGLNRSVINGSTRSQLQWIENLAASVRTDKSLPNPLPQLASDLGIRNGLGAQDSGATDDAAQDEYTYELELSMHPPEKDKDFVVEKVAKVVTKAAKKLLDKLPTGMKLGGSLGELKVHRKGKNSPNKNWEQTYKVFAGGFGFALELGGQTDLSGKGAFVTSEEWTQRDFPGAFKILDGGVWFAPRPSDVAKVATKGKDKHDWKKVDEEVGKAIGQLPAGARQVLRAGARDVALIIEGAGNHATEIVPFEAAKKVGTGLGASFFCSFGWIRMPDELVTVNDTRPLGVREMQIAAQGTARAHFELGAAVLSKDGRQALRRLCAAELPWFLRDDTFIELTAHCDLVRFRRSSDASTMSDIQPELKALGEQAKTDDLRNMQLAIYRAANVKQAIKDILGDRLKIPDSGLKENPMGKKEAEEAKSKGYEPYRNPHRRRVDVTMNGRYVLTLTEA